MKTIKNLYNFWQNILFNVVKNADNIKYSQQLQNKLTNIKHCLNNTFSRHIQSNFSCKLSINRTKKYVGYQIIIPCIYIFYEITNKIY